jgi:segregation and condensation protein A
MQDQLYTLLVEKDDISWRSLIHDLVRSQKMDPWDVNITLLAQKYIQRLKQLKEMDLKVSGKVVLAAAILLKIKSNKLVGDDMLEFDRLLVAHDPEDEGFYDDLETEMSAQEREEREKESFPIYPRNPQPRKRKVSVFDLLDALEKALEVKHRRENRIHQVPVEAPDDAPDIGDVLKGLFAAIIGFFKRKKPLTFDQLMVGKSKEEKLSAFVPLLYLSNEQKLKLAQDGHYGAIQIMPPGEKNVNA